MSGILEHGDEYLNAVERILDKVGKFAIGPMLDALATTESRTMRHRLLNALTSLGPAVGPPAVARLEDAQWFVQRNILIVLASVPEWPAKFDPEIYATHDDPRVRREAIKLMLQGTQRPELRPRGLVLSLGDEDDAVMRLGLTAALDECAPPAEPLLAKLLDHDDEEVRVLAIRVFGTLRSRRARDLLLQQVLAKKKWWRRTRLNQPTPEMLAALRGLAGTWARQPEVEVVMTLAGRSAIPEVRSAAGLA
jgi:HEAT repeat protein